MWIYWRLWLLEGDRYLGFLAAEKLYIQSFSLGCPWRYDKRMTILGNNPNTTIITIIPCTLSMPLHLLARPYTLEDNDPEDVIIFILDNECQLSLLPLWKLAVCLHFVHWLLLMIHSFNFFSIIRSHIILRNYFYALASILVQKLES